MRKLLYILEGATVSSFEKFVGCGNDNVNILRFSCCEFKGELIHFEVIDRELKIPDHPWLLGLPLQGIENMTVTNNSSATLFYKRTCQL